MTLRWLGKKLLRITGISLGILLVLLTAFHIWFVSRAKSLLEETVKKRSDGRISLKIDKLRYNYFNHRMNIRNAVFVTTDSSTAPTAYRFAVKEIKLQLRALLPLLLEDQLLIDSLRLQSPDIRVTTLRIVSDSVSRRSKEVSIPYELGKVYNSIQDALQVLRVTRFHIDDGVFTLVNKAQPNQVPLRISNIQAQIDNLRVDTTELSGREKLLFSDNVILHCTNQDILFPDGRHRLAFSGFRINLDKQLVEFDSCTIAASRTDSSLSSFHVFFDTLRLTHIDFDTLYRSEVIKADSVYCLNPAFELVAETSKKKAGKRPLPKIENIVKQLTGNLLLGFVGVENADFNIRITNEGNPSTYTFTRNSFVMQGLSIDQEAEKPITVKSFGMAIRNYENFIKDSSYNIRFDSVLFRDDGFILSDFHFNKLDRGRILNSFRIPRFRLEGLSWDDLLFEKKLRARSAVLISPDIDYTPTPNPRRRQNLFQSLGAVNEYMDLDQLFIENGRIDLKLKKGFRVRLENASLSVKSQSLLRSTRLSAIRNSLNAVSFDKGIIETGKTTLELRHLRYTGETEKFAAGSIRVFDHHNHFDAALEDITVDQMIVDETTGDVFADGINWQKAGIRLHPPDTSRVDAARVPIIELRNIYGQNTDLEGTWKGVTFSTSLDEIRMGQLDQHPGKKLLITGLNANGKSLQAMKGNQEFSADAYRFIDRQPSALHRIKFRSDPDGATTDISALSLSFTPHLEQLLDGALVIDDVTLSEPLIRMNLDTGRTNNNRPRFPVIKINTLSITRPELHLSRQNKSGRLNIDWYSNRKYPADLLLKGIYTNENNQDMLQVSSLETRVADLHLTNRQGITFTSDKGTALARISDLSVMLTPGKHPGSSAMDWKARLDNLDLQNFRFDSLGKNMGHLSLSSARITALDIGSSISGSVKKWLLSNKGFQIQNVNGDYRDSSSLFHWRNAGYDRAANLLMADTFSYRPAQDRKSFLAGQKFQADYIEAGSGPVKIGAVDLAALLNDSSLHIEKARLENAYFIDYKDKTLPFNPGIIKPLPVALLRKIPFNIIIDSIEFQNGNVFYTELNDKTKKTGTIPVNNMTVFFTNLRNHKIHQPDSLEILASGVIFDSVWTKLRVNQSYTDPEGGFIMTVKMKPGDLAQLNSALVPLASLKIVSGHVDSLELRAVGREYLALGEMKMRYDNLKIRILKDGNEDKKTLRTRLMNLVANSLIIRSRNKSRTGDVFFMRHRDRSAINYLIQITFSGIASSTGVKNNKKQLRRYRKELKEKGLPPYDTQ